MITQLPPYIAFKRNTNQTQAAVRSIGDSPWWHDQLLKVSI